MRTLADLLSAPERNDIEALTLMFFGWLATMPDPEAAAVLLWAFVVACAFVFQRWHARLQ